MPYTLVKWALWLIAAAGIGLVVGWMLRGVRRAPVLAAADDEVADLARLRARASDADRIANDCDRLRIELDECRAAAATSIFCRRASADRSCRAAWARELASASFCVAARARRRDGLTSSSASLSAVTGAVGASGVLRFGVFSLHASRTRRISAGFRVAPSRSFCRMTGSPLSAIASRNDAAFSLPSFLATSSTKFAGAGMILSLFVLRSLFALRSFAASSFT